jgi:dGTPase
LARKTQVHPLATNDHIHNRLTHSLEVACVGRSLGIRVGLKLAEEGVLPEGISATDIGDIVQSTCLAHDIGNPPFGHTGEEAIKSWFSSQGSSFLTGMSPQEKDDLGFFEGNAQGLRVLTSVENHLNDGGMRLTYATLAAFIKYPWTSLPAQQGKRPKNNKYGVFTSELEIFEEIANNVGLLKREGDDWYCRHPLVHLMESADDFCYGILDLEDGLEMGILKWDEIYDILRPVIPSDSVVGLEKDLDRLSPGRRTPLLRGKVIDRYVEAASDAFIKHSNKYLEGDQSNLIDLCDDPIKSSIRQAKSIASEKVFNHRRKIELEIGSYNVISTLLTVMCESAHEWANSPKNLSFRSKRVIDLIGETTFDPRINNSASSDLSPDYLAQRRVVDFISGMTDNYATFLAKQFNGMGI